MNLIPLGDRVLIRPEARPTQTASGLYVSEHKKPHTAGWVVSVGELVKDPSVRVGDYVLFSWQSGQLFDLDDEQFLIMKETDLLAVVEEVTHG
jgi:chaperonin GroES